MKTQHTLEGETRPYWLETIEHVKGGRVEVRTVRLSWVHGIYGTHEEALYTVVTEATGPELVVDSRGSITPLHLHPLDSVVCEHLAATS